MPETKETGGDVTAPRAQDKLGLALSGGGFRAAFFHIGVLARMADLGLLRHVEVISTVSGGSIIGALYYLHVKRLLERTPDAEVTDQDYCDIIATVERDFFQGVCQNLRMRAFCNPFKNIRMALDNYSRSDRMGELYDKVFYRPVLAPGRRAMIKMNELKIQPKGVSAPFAALKHNVGRAAKVPILVINSTVLNTGRNWRFEAVRMGEPEIADPASADIDRITRLQRAPSYEAITPQQRDIELGMAVAASACVPAIFPPLAISGLYPDTRVQLVDAGIHDNQGIRALCDMGCTAFVVSDASQQMATVAEPSTRTLGVTGRTTDILMERVRQEELHALLRDHAERTAFMHLLRGVAPKFLPWIDQNKKPASVPVPPPPPADAIDFGVAPAAQTLLAEIRTDLDAFSEVEAQSLMMDGYVLSAPEIARCAWCGQRAGAVPGPVRWKFARIAPWLRRPTDAYKKQLRIGRKKFFKVLRLSVIALLVTVTALAAIVGGIVYAAQDAILTWLNMPITLMSLVIPAALVLLGFVPLVKKLIESVTFLRAPARFLLRALVPAVASVFFVLYLWIYNPLFLYLGCVDRLKPPADGQ